MNTINFQKEITGSVEDGIRRVTDALKGEGFGVLTRIDMHAKIKEKIGKEITPVVILGACNPTFAFEAHQANQNVASLIPCNVVVRELSSNRLSIELVKPSAMLRILEDASLNQMVEGADQALKRVLDHV